MYVIDLERSQVGDKEIRQLENQLFHKIILDSIILRIDIGVSSQTLLVDITLLIECDLFTRILVVMIMLQMEFPHSFLTLVDRVIRLIESKHFIIVLLEV